MTRRSKSVLGGLLTLAIIVIVAFFLRPMSFLNAATDLKLLMSGARPHSAMVAGHRLHYLVAGPASGPPVVLIHGLGGSAENWQNLAPFVARAGYRVYLLDLLGYGKSDKPVDFSYSVSDQANVVVGFLDALNLKQVDLGGWSMGGWIVQLVAVLHPERVHKLMLFDSGGIAYKIGFDPNVFTPSDVQELLQFAELLMSRTPPPMPTFIRTDMLRSMKENAWVVRRTVASMLTLHDTTENVLPRLKMPVLIVWGAEDRVTPMSIGETMHNLIPGSELQTVPVCGHLAPLECTDQIGPRVVTFLKK